MSQKVFERREKKYMLSGAQRSELYKYLMQYMQPDSFGRTTICSIYYDTLEDSMIRSSIEKPVYKEKLRLRSYGIPDDDTAVFVEIKKKYKGVVYKRRIEMPLKDACRFLSGEKVEGYDSQIKRELEWSIGFYKPVPKCMVAYDRIALFCRDMPELRVTFDENIRCRGDRLDLRCGSDGERIIPSDACMMEIKTINAMPLWLCSKLSEMNIFPTSFSKYGTYFIEQNRNMEE